MRRIELLQEVRKMRFEEIYGIWGRRSITQEEAARMLGVCDRTFRRYADRYEEEGLKGLMDKRLVQASSRCAPVDEVMELTAQYKSRYMGWNVKHFYSWYKRDNGIRSYSWVKKELQSAGLVPKGKKAGVHRKRREPAPLPGMMLHQDGSDHEWVEGKKWDLIVTMDDATNEHYSIFFVEEEGTASSLRGIRGVIEKRGLLSSLYTDRGSHYWNTPEAGGKVDKHNLTQFGRAMRQLGIEMIPAYSPEARGRSERAFKTHQERLPKEVWPSMRLARWRGPIVTLKRHICLPSMPSSHIQPHSKEAPLFPCSVSTLTTYFASSMNVRSAPTTASGLKGKSYRYRKMNTGIIT